jgi:hypothetical protein
VLEEEAIGVQWLGGGDIGVDGGGGTVGLPLASAPTGSVRLEFVGSHVARQSLDCLLGISPCFYSAVQEGATANDMANTPDLGA